MHVHRLFYPKPIDTQDVYPITHIEDLLDKLAHVNWFLKMDLAQRYHQIQITPVH